MGSQMEKVLDYEGKSYAIFDESSLYDDTQIGNQLSDFEILEVLSDEENSNFVAKVRSIQNHKIYALKRIIIQDYNQRMQYYQQVQNLIQLNHPHLIKYYKSFAQNENFYLVMEYMNNSDIDGFRKAHQVLGKNIKEEEIWNILLQCLSALDYVYSGKFNNFLGFKICNIFMNNEQNAKIGISHPTNNCTDIFLLGKCFYAMCFSQDENVKDRKFLEVELQQIQQMGNTNYSEELLNIINLMLNDNNNVDINTLYTQVKNEYCKKYAKNSSINSVLRCLYSYPKLNNEICQRENKFYNSQQYYISYIYFSAIRTLQGAYQNNLNQFIEDFRRAIATENSKLDGSKEIDPLYLLAFLLEKMHKEMNEVEEGELNEGEEVDRTNKEQTFNQFVNYINSNINSPISDLFLGINKTKRICQTCKNGYYYFNNFCFVIFDLTAKNDKNFNLFNDGFLYQYNCEKRLEPDKPDRVSCEKCLTYQFHYEFNRYYVMSKQLIISFLRGNNYENNTNVYFDEKLDLSQLVDEKDISQFYLVGCINRMVIEGKEEFIYWARDPDNINLWHKSKINPMNKQSYGHLDEHSKLNINEIMSTGQIIILFYNEVNNK